MEGEQRAKITTQMHLCIDEGRRGPATSCCRAIRSSRRSAAQALEVRAAFCIVKFKFVAFYCHAVLFIERFGDAGAEARVHVDEAANVADAKKQKMRDTLRQRR